MLTSDLLRGWLHHLHQRARGAGSSRLDPAPAPRAAALAARRGHIAPGLGALARCLGLLGLAFRRPGLVHRGGGDPLRGVLGASSLLQALLDVVVLALPFRAPGFLRHDCTSFRRSCKSRARYASKRAGSTVRRSPIRSRTMSGAGPDGGSLA